LPRGCIVPAGYPRIFNFAWALRDSVVVVYNNNFKQVLTLYPRKIKNTSATQMRGFKDYYFISLLRRFATRNDGMQDGFPPSLTIYVYSVNLSFGRGNDGKSDNEIKDRIFYF
jgi:hypothetical protein